jgi:acyl carrier protein
MTGTGEASAMDGHAVAEDVIGTLATMLNREPGSISPGTRFFDDLGFDSTSILVLLMQLENDLGVEFDPETLEPEDLETIGSLVEFVTRQLTG